MPRPERPLDPASGPVAAFAAELRKLRENAGSPKYLQMARRTGRSRTALAEAAGGDHLPTWETVEAYVRACDADPRDWLPRWERAKEQVRGPEGGALWVDAPASPVPPQTSGPAPEAPRHRLLRYSTLAVCGVGLVLLGSVLPIPSLLPEDDAPEPPFRLLAAANGGGTSVAYSRFGAFAAGDVAIGGTGGRVQIWDAGSARLLRRFDTGDPRVTTIEFDPLNRNLLVTAGTNGLVRVWDTKTGEKKWSEPTRPPGYPVVVAFDPRTRDSVAVAGGGNGVVRIWDAQEHETVRTFTADATAISAMAFDPHNAGVLATAGPDGVTIWDFTLGEQRALGGVPGAVTALAFDPFTRNTLAVATSNGPAGIWDSSDGKPVRLLKGGRNVTSLSFNPLIRNSLAGGDASGAVHVWDASNGLGVKALTGQSTPVTSLEYAGDGETLAAGSSQGVRLWRVRDW